MRILGLAQSAGVQEDLAGSRIAGRIFIGQAKIECAERNPAGFSAPSHVDDALAIGQQRFEPGACLRGGLRLPPRDEREGTGLDADEGQSCLSQGPKMRSRTHSRALWRRNSRRAVTILSVVIVRVCGRSSNLRTSVLGGLRLRLPRRDYWMPRLKRGMTPGG